MEFIEVIDIIKDQRQNGLPGEDAQYALAPKSRSRKTDYLKNNKEYRSSSVLICIYPSIEGEASVMLIKRTGNTGVHSGQIAFPGGKAETFDESLWHTATREAEEEVGIITENVLPIGELTSLIIPVSNFIVHPFVGYVNTTPEFIANPEEVHQLVPVPLTDLVNMPIKSKMIETSYGKIEAPFFSLHHHDIWGATAMIISEFNQMISSTLNK